LLWNLNPASWKGIERIPIAEGNNDGILKLGNKQLQTISIKLKTYTKSKCKRKLATFVMI